MGNGGGERWSKWGMVGEKGDHSGEWWGRRVVKAGNDGGEGWSKRGMVGEKGGQSGEWGGGEKGGQSGE